MGVLNAYLQMKKTICYHQVAMHIMKAGSKWALK